MLAGYTKKLASGIDVWRNMEMDWLRAKGFVNSGQPLSISLFFFPIVPTFENIGGQKSGKMEKYYEC